MAEKTLNTRIQQKHDIEANWLKAVNFIPKVGEVIIYDIDETHTTPRMKIGDGVKNINELEFIGDKAAAPDWNASEGEPGYIENRTHYAELGEILLETNIVVSEDFGQGEVTTSISLEVGKTYIVTLNNMQYTCTAWQVSNAPVVVLGNGLMVGEEAYGSNEPFAIGIVPKDNETNALVLITNPSEYSIKIATESIYHKLDYKYIPNSDWGARVDEPGHILNRTHWEEKEIDVALEEVSIPYNTYNNCFYITNEFNFFPLEGTAYVTFNGERYETKCIYGDDDAEGVTSFDIGNKFLRHDDEENTGEPFFIHILYYANSGYNSMNCYLLANSDIVDTITLKVEGIKTRNIQQLDPIFLPNSNIINGVAEGSIRMLNTSEEIGLDAFAEGIYTTASGRNSHAEGNGTVASGVNSHAEGYSSAAKKYGSHAEGANTTANGVSSHAEGQSTTADGESSHAEGYGSVATGDNSHAEGTHAEASGHSSHAEGYGTTAQEYSSHAEGDSTTASGETSHAEGEYTISSGRAQHVQGRYNVEDTSELDMYRYRKYAHIVGNGNSTSRSNAHTLDWSGNGWFAGGLKVGGTGQDDTAAVSVLTENDMTAITNAEIDVLFQ